MFQVKRGRIKLFNKDKGWGFIIPNDGSKDVFFHVSGFNWPAERYHGELMLDEFKTDIPDQWKEAHPYQAPVENDWVVYLEYAGKKGPATLNWSYEAWWDEAQKVIDAREDPCHPKIQVWRWKGPERQLVWTGTYEKYRQKLDQDFPEIWEPYVHTEEYLATGWQRAWHPCNWHDSYKTIPKDWVDCEVLAERLGMPVRSVYNFFQGTVRVDDDPETPIHRQHCPALGVGLRLHDYTPQGGMPSSHFKMPAEDAEILIKLIEEFRTAHHCCLR